MKRLHGKLYPGQFHIDKNLDIAAQPFVVAVFISTYYSFKITIEVIYHDRYFCI
jgi:hypothetical protein